MDISTEEKEYIGKIYRNGLNHFVEDTIPNKLICVHNIHWCLETLLRKATKDDATLNYRDGFEKIFRRFCSKYESQIPRGLKKEVERLNEIRNGIQHRRIFPDMPTLKGILPRIYQFTKWLMKTVFKSSLDIYSIPESDLRLVLEDLYKWKETILGQNWGEYLRNIHELNTKKVKLRDYLFACIIPATSSGNLIDFLTTTPNSPYSDIENYFRDLNVLDLAQVVANPKNLREYNDLGEKFKLHTDGRMYGCIDYGELFQVKDIPLSQRGSDSEILKERYLFNLAPLSVESRRINCTKFQEKYGIPIEHYSPGNLEHLLKVACFAFHPECKIKLVKKPTEYFNAFFIFPYMIMGRRSGRRILYHRDTIRAFREYQGDETDLEYVRSFKYDEISNVIEDLVSYCHGFFKHPRDTLYVG